MKQVVPDYYGEFACIAGACRHSCCIGWEIDIDEDSLAYYRGLPGAFGERLRANIDTGGESACFRLAKDERCPFLNGDGLCDIILELGQDSLCQICDDHPRFRNFFSDREEMGLGLCCEAAGRLVLSRETPVSFIEEEDGTDAEALSEDEEGLLELRTDLIDIAHDRRFSMETRVQRMLEYSEIPMDNLDLDPWGRFFMQLERLDEAWLPCLRLLEKGTAGVSSKWDIPFEQLMVYLLWRHLPGAIDDGDLRGRIAYCALVWHMLRRMFAMSKVQDMDALVEICRLYSSEIEYSDENIAAILDELHRLVPGL